MEGDRVPTIQPLDLHNWFSWSQQIEGLLDYKECWIGGVEEEEIGDTKQPLSQVKTRKARGLISMYVKEHLKSDVLACKTGKEAMQKLKDICRVSSRSMVMQLQRELVTLKKGTDEEVGNLIARARDLARRWKQSEERVDEQQEVGKAVLYSLPEQYDNIVSLILKSENPYNLDLHQADLLELEQRMRSRAQHAKPDSSPPIAFFNNNFTRPGRTAGKTGGGQDKSHVRCHGCGRLGHYKNECKRPSKCSFCLIEGHTESDCRKKRLGQRRQEIRPQQANAGSVTYMAVELAMGPTEAGISGCEWLLDTGATQHMTNNSRLIKDMRASELLVYYGNGSSNKAAGVGEVNFISRTSTGHVAVKLRKVYYFPELPANLFSIKQATQSGATLEGDNHSLKLKQGNLVTIEGQARGNTWVAQTHVPTAMVAKPKETPALWHR
jgi:hypothetical protein